MQKTTNIINYFTDTYELESADLDWGLGYSILEYKGFIPIQYAIEKNILKMIKEIHLDYEIYCTENIWNKDNSKLTITFEIRKSK